VTQFRIQKLSEQEVSDLVKNPRRIEHEIESSPSKFGSRKYLPTNKKIVHLQKDMNSVTDVSKGELTARAAKEDKNDTEDRARKDKKLTEQITN
jgi:hypothetical protein